MAEGPAENHPGLGFADEKSHSALRQMIASDHPETPVEPRQMQIMKLDTDFHG
jgi:hypothetical protein